MGGAEARKFGGGCAGRVEVGPVAWVECLRIWYFPRLASGSCVGMALGPGRCYLRLLLRAVCRRPAALATVAFVAPMREVLPSLVSQGGSYTSERWALLRSRS